MLSEGLRCQTWTVKQEVALFLTTAQPVRDQLLEGYMMVLVAGW